MSLPDSCLEQLHAECERAYRAAIKELAETALLREQRAKAVKQYPTAARSGGIHIDELLARLESVRDTGPQRWVAKCPAHLDKTPSLSIRVAESGNVLLYDFGGCIADDICAAIGISIRDLFSRSAPRRAA